MEKCEYSFGESYYAIDKKEASNFYGLALDVSNQLQHIIKYDNCLSSVDKNIGKIERMLDIRCGTDHYFYAFDGIDNQDYLNKLWLAAYDKNKKRIKNVKNHLRVIFYSFMDTLNPLFVLSITYRGKNIEPTKNLKLSMKKVYNNENDFVERCF